MRKLPDAEFDIMQAIWVAEPPITASRIIALSGKGEIWKAQTVNTLLSRLIERGFITSEKNGRERLYYPLIGKEQYLQFETESFMKQYHGNSFMSFVHTLVDGQQLSDEDIEEMLRWMQEREE